MLKKSDLTIHKNRTGGYVISAIIDGYLITRQFYYYTKKEATRLFMEENKKGTK
jgi:hypothetical protein